jgi:hypothetical protein
MLRIFAVMALAGFGSIYVTSHEAYGALQRSLHIPPRVMEALQVPHAMLEHAEAYANSLPDKVRFDPVFQP